MIDDEAERGWAAQWIAAILAREKIDMTPEAKEHLWSALSSLASAPAGERTLTGLSVLLQSQSLKGLFNPIASAAPLGGCWMLKPSGWALLRSRCSKPRG